MSLEVVTDHSVLRRIYSTRWQVLTQLGVPKAIYPDGIIHDPQDSIGTHYAIRNEDDLLAAARFSVHLTVADLPSPHYFTTEARRLTPPIGSMNRLFVVPGARRLGYASQL